MESIFKKKIINKKKESINKSNYFDYFKKRTINEESIDKSNYSDFLKSNYEFINNIDIDKCILNKNNITLLENKFKKYIMNQEDILQYGNDYESFEEELFTGCLVNTKDNCPVNGLIYERNEDMIYWYCSYIDGYKDDVLVKFYDNNNIKSIESISYNMLEGIYLKLNEEQNLVELGKCHLGVKLKYYKFDKQKNIIESKEELTRAESIIIKTRERAMAKK